MDISSLFGGSSRLMSNMLQSMQNSQKQTEDAFSVSDIDGSGTLNQEEFDSFNKIMQETMGGVALPGMEGIEDAAELYNTLDEDESGELTLEEIKPLESSLGSGAAGGEEKDEIEDLMEDLMSQMQQTLLNMMDSANNADDEEDSDTVTALLNESNIQEYLNQALTSSENLESSGGQASSSVSVVA